MKNTEEAVVIANLGSSAGENIVGSPAITIGAPYGTVGSLAYGMVTSNGKKQKMIRSWFCASAREMLIATP
jgi:hypothetical protein